MIDAHQKSVHMNNMATEALDSSTYGVRTGRAIAFDTHQFVKRLTKAGMPVEQAEVLADEQANLVETQLANKRDLKESEMRLKIWTGSLLVVHFTALLAAMMAFQLLK